MRGGDMSRKSLTTSTMASEDDIAFESVFVPDRDP